MNLGDAKRRITVKGNAESGGAAEFKFNGAGWLEIADHKSLRGSGGLTLTAWINPTGPIPGNGMRLLDKSRAGVGNGYLLDTYPKGKALRFFAGEPALTARVDIPEGKWTHVAASLDGKTGKRILYLNGKKVAEK